MPWTRQEHSELGSEENYRTPCVFSLHYIEEREEREERRSQGEDGTEVTLPQSFVDRTTTTSTTTTHRPTRSSDAAEYYSATVVCPRAFVILSSGPIHVHPLADALARSPMATRGGVH